MLRSFSDTVVEPHISLYFKAESVWTHFNNLSQAGLPTPDELFRIALLLYDNYSTPTASTIFMLGCQPNSPVVSIGEPWREEEDTEPKLIPTGADDVDAEQGEEEDGSTKDKGEGGPKERKNAVPAKDEDFDGDRTLMRSALLMYEALVSKEVAQAVAEGDIGRVYEGIKVSDEFGPSLNHILIGYSSCCSHLRAPRITSTPAICSTRSPSWKLMPGRSCGNYSYGTG